MNEFIIKEHNKLVQPEDTVLFLGDFKFYDGTFREYLNNLNGQFIFVKGNHDSITQLKKEKIAYHESIKLTVNSKVKIFLTHNPENAKRGINLVAHVHEKWQVYADDYKFMINVGVDKNDFKPHNLKDLLQTFLVHKGLRPGDPFWVELELGDYRINMG